MLLTTNYGICFRRERGFCDIDFSVQPSDASNFNLGSAEARTVNKLYFIVWRNKRHSIFQGGDVPDNNKAVYLDIPGTENDFYSGQIFADKTGSTTTSTRQTTNGVVRAMGPTFRINVMSTQDTVPSTAADRAATGFYLTYNQVAC